MPLPPDARPPDASAERVPTAELLARARERSGEAVEALFRRFAPRVRGLAAVRMGRSLVDLVDSEDLVQETMLTALRKLDRFEARGDGEFVCWLASIVASRVQDARRRAASVQRGGGRVVRRADLGVTTVTDLAGPARDPSPSRQLAAKELDGRLERALLALGSPLREIVYCRLVLDMGFAEIAGVHGLASGDSARALFHKALARLRERLADPPPPA